MSGTDAPAADTAAADTTAEETIVVRARLFAMLRECAGADTIELRLPAEASVADALAELSRTGALGEALSAMQVAVAVNREYAGAQTTLRAGDELALIPPLSGGQEAGHEPPAVLTRVSDEPLSLEALATAVADPAAGAIVLFQGVTRELPLLHYEAYTEMASERIAAIAAECASRPGVCALAAEHRVGAVELGQPSVIVAASAAHRAEAFAAAREAIDRIKAEAPIWKREQTADGQQRWVQGTPAPTSPPGSALASAPASLSASGRLTHLDEHGRARMVDVGDKETSERVACARARLRMSHGAAAAVRDGNGPKGEVLTVARIAGIQAGKQAGALIPLAHPLPLTYIDVSAEVDVRNGVVELVSEARTVARTGVEMEAMTACSVAALTVYDMVKGIERGVEIEQVVLLSKRGGRSDYVRDEVDVVERELKVDAAEQARTLALDTTKEEDECAPR